MQICIIVRLKYKRQDTKSPEEFNFMYTVISYIRLSLQLQCTFNSAERSIMFTHPWSQDGQVLKTLMVQMELDDKRNH